MVGCMDAGNAIGMNACASESLQKPAKSCQLGLGFLLLLAAKRRYSGAPHQKEGWQERDPSRA